MPSSNTILLTIVGCTIVTWVSRVMPFVLLKHFTLPKKVMDYLMFVPIVIMTTLWFSNMFTPQAGHLPEPNWTYLIVTLPTFLSAVLTKSLLIIVVVGIVSLAILRMIGLT